MLLKKRRPKLKGSTIKDRIIAFLIWIIYIILLLEIGLRIGGFIFLFLQEYRNRSSIRQKGEYRILCLGDSMTTYTYPRPLEEILNERMPEIKFSVIDKGRGGADSGFVIATLNENLDKYNPDMVVVMMGVNDNGNVLPYGNIPRSKKIPFKVYRLARILWYNIASKVREIGVFTKKKDKEDISDRKEVLMQMSDFEEPAETKDEHKKATEINPQSDRKYVQLGCLYKNLGRYDKAEEMLKKAIEINLQDDRAYIELGDLYRIQGRYDKAEEMLKKAIEINPEDDNIYSELGVLYWFYRFQKEHYKAEEMFKKAIEINPENVGAYVMLGRLYKMIGKYDKAEEVLERAIALRLGSEWAYVELGSCYLHEREYDKAVEMLKKAIEINPESDKLCGILAHLYEEQGENNSAEEYFRKANRLRSEYYASITRHNYQTLKEVVTQRGVKLVCMQYPVRGIEPLKKMLRPHEGIIFVDNEMVFKKALRQGRHDEYFVDMYGGDFGHCTPKGNRLMAENIANVILKEVFNK